jgi:hypothetical protein
LAFNDSLHELFGAPSQAYITYTTPQPGQLDVVVTLVNKTSTRYPEAAYFTFDPLGNDQVNGSGIWTLDKLGYPLDVTDVAQGGGRGLQTVLSGLQYTGGQVSPTGCCTSSTSWL